MLMSEWNKNGDAALDAELSRLKDALHELPPTAGGEQALRRAFRARRAIRWADADGSGRRRATLVAGALAASITIAAVVLVGLVRIDGDAVEGTAAQAPGAANGEQAGMGEHGIATTAFQPLSYAPGVSPAQAYNIVRVRIPLSSLVGYDAPVDGTIEADLLVGEDGLARGIRFDTADAPLVSMVSH
jgi:hypothetical protein